MRCASLPLKINEQTALNERLMSDSVSIPLETRQEPHLRIASTEATARDKGLAINAAPTINAKACGAPKSLGQR